MKVNNRRIFEALALAGVNVRRVSLNLSPVVCRDDSADEYHTHVNGCGWSIVSSEGIVERLGRITRAGRVTEFKGGEQIALPFGGHWEHAAEKIYQLVRWNRWNATG